MTKLNYKIETKNNIFQVTFEKGSYSQRRTTTINISAISPEHCWQIVTKLHSNLIELDIHDNYTSSLTQILENDKDYNLRLDFEFILWSDEFGEYKNNLEGLKDWDGDQLTHNSEEVFVTIEKLNVIYLNEN